MAPGGCLLMHFEFEGRTSVYRGPSVCIKNSFLYIKLAFLTISMYFSLQALPEALEKPKSF